MTQSEMLPIWLKTVPALTLHSTRALFIDVLAIATEVEDSVPCASYISSSPTSWIIKLMVRMIHHHKCKSCE